MKIFIILMFFSIFVQVFFFVQVFSQVCLRAFYTVSLVTLVSGIRPSESVGIEPELSV